MVREARERYAADATVPGGALPKLHACARVYRGFLEAAAALGDDKQNAIDFVAGFGSYLHYVVNFDLHHRKVFWVDESLAWMLLQTNLDIDGRALELPFPSFALAFQDETTLALMRGHVRRVASDVTADGAAVQSFTVYVTRGEEGPDGVDVDFSFAADLGARQLPHLTVRTLHVRDGDDLDTLLESDSFRAPAFYEGREALRTPELTRLMQLVINSILYATSSQHESCVLSSPARVALAKVKDLGRKRQGRASGRLAALRQQYSSESVVRLGMIPISSLRTLREAEDRAGGHELLRRFMVRGHWRRPPSTWDDQRLRWIAPYWKGPEMAALIERQYRMMI